MIILLFLIGSYLIVAFADLYWSFSFWGLFLSFLVLTQKLPSGDAIKLFAVVLSVALLLFGGGVVIARNWGDFAAGGWVVFVILFHVIFLKRIMRLIPVFNLAEKFDDMINEAEEKSKEKE